MGLGLDRDPPTHLPRGPHAPQEGLGAAISPFPSRSPAGGGAEVAMEAAVPAEEALVLVEYGFEYRAKDGTLVSIKPNERYVLLKRTNHHWWHVKRSGDTRPFYIPAQYVKELPPIATPAPLDPPPPGPAGTDPGVPTEMGDRASGALQRSRSRVSRLLHLGKVGSTHGCTQPAGGRRCGVTSTLRAPSRISPRCLRHGGGTGHRWVPRCPSQKPQQGHPGNAVPSSSAPRLAAPIANRSTQVTHPYPLQARKDPEEPPTPIYLNIQELREEAAAASSAPEEPGSSVSDWETHTDTDSGHLFYYNPVTGETTWDCPFGQAEDGVSPVASPASSLAHSPEFPEWEQYVDEASGQAFFYNSVTGETSWDPPHAGDGGSSGDMYPGVTRYSPMEQRVTAPVSTSWCPLPPEKGVPGGRGDRDYAVALRDPPLLPRKNWSSSWTVLEGGILTFFKDSKHSARHPSTLTTPEHTVELRGATLAWAGKDKSSKKHVLELKTREGSEFLIQHDSEQIIAAWQKAIADSIGRRVSGRPLTPTLPPRGRARGSDTAPSLGHRPPHDSSKVRNKLRKFLQRRPTLQSLRERGYIKDQVFGCSLQALCERERGTVPRFVLQCIQTVERRGLDIDGLYRVSGNLATVQKLRYKVEHDEHLDLDDGRWEDIHVVTGALKLFFRELPEPLVPLSHFDKFIAAIKMQDPTRRGRCVRDLVFSLPPAHHDTMKVLFRHLCRVIEYKEENRMSVQSIAIVFGPTLLRPASEEGNMAMHMVFQNQVVEHILNQYSYIFPDG
uniref:Rho GTPase activating protein 27 n=1 Tax=Strix occidentalis caurina TaxID=311401 RepID=A0A8D0FQ60_STROC